MFKGSFVAIVTPFRNGEIDFNALGELIEFQIENGTTGIVPCGTTGESATLSMEEHQSVVEYTVSKVAKRALVMAGTGSNSTEEAIILTEHAKDCGADAALLIAPYYNKPTQEGLYLHYKAIAEAVDIPQFLYNVPGRTVVNILPETVARLSRVKNIAGIKEATANLQQITDVIALSRDDFVVLSGDDSTVFPTLAIGGHGVISVTANVAPKEMSDLCKKFFAGDLNGAREIHYRLRKLNDAMFYETNPIPVKAALNLMGKITDEIRLPLTGMSAGNRQKLKTIMEEFGIL